MAASTSLVLIWYCCCPRIRLYAGAEVSWFQTPLNQSESCVFPLGLSPCAFPLQHYDSPCKKRPGTSVPASLLPSRRSAGVPPGRAIPDGPGRPRQEATPPAPLPSRGRRLFFPQRYEEVGAAVRSPAGRSLRRRLPVARYVSTAGRGAGSRAGGVGAAVPRGRPGGSWGAARGGG